jgi:U3 small nucleolar RNA-associated protein 14
LIIIYVPSQQLQGQLQTKHSADIGNCIMGKHYLKSKVNYWNTIVHENRQTDKLIMMIITNTEY